MNTIKCPNCGQTLPEDSAFCNKCGSRIDGGANYRRRERDYEDWSDDDNNAGRERRKRTTASASAISTSCASI